MKILAIGDPHGDMEKIKKIPLKNVDLILLTGDLGSANLMRKMTFENISREKQGLPEKKYSHFQEKRAIMEAYTSTIRLVRYLSKFAPVFTIFGNIEFSNRETKEHSKYLGMRLPYFHDKLTSMKRVRIINNVVANFNGLKIGGLEYFTDTNWVRDFKPSHYKSSLAHAKKQTDKAKRILRRFDDINIDILVCHQPPYNVLDKVKAKFAPRYWQGKHAGSEAVLHFIKKSQPRYVFCGHIHEGAGMKKVGKTEVYNLGTCGYKLIEI